MADLRGGTVGCTAWYTGGGQQSRMQGAGAKPAGMKRPMRLQLAMSLLAAGERGPVQGGPPPPSTRRTPRSGEHGTPHPCLWPHHALPPRRLCAAQGQGRDHRGQRRDRVGLTSRAPAAASHHALS